MRRLYLFATLGVMVVCGCASEVVVIQPGDPATDQDSPGAAQGVPGGGGQGGSGASAAQCATQAPIGTLSQCGSADGSQGAGLSPGYCYRSDCDEQGNEWTSLCGGGTCYCMFNNEDVCTCATDTDQACNGVAASCCPPPFPG